MSAHAKQDLSDKLDDEMKKKVMNMPSLDIFPISVPMKETEFYSVSMYCDDKGIAKNLPINSRAAGFVEACGYNIQRFHGDCYVSRIFDNEDDWKRCSITTKDLARDAPWLKKCREIRDRSGAKDLGSMSSLMAQQAGGAGGASGPTVTGPGVKMPDGVYDLPSEDKGLYSWKQELDEVEITVPMKPHGELTKKDFKVTIQHKAVSVKLNDGTVLCEGKLSNTVDTDESSWTYMDGNLEITLVKGIEERWMNLFVEA